MSKAEFREQIRALTSALAGRELNPELQAWLNTEHSPRSNTFRRLAAACREGVEQGWLCQHEAGGIRYGRVFKPDDELHGFSVDVVDMNDCAGPHHRHPNGEIDLVMPLEGEARFDDHPAGWVVYAADSAHVPKVTGGRALVLYLLPAGSIEFTR